MADENPTTTETSTPKKSWSIPKPGKQAIIYTIIGLVWIASFLYSLAANRSLGARIGNATTTLEADEAVNYLQAGINAGLLPSAQTIQQILATRTATSTK